MTYIYKSSNIIFGNYSKSPNANLAPISQNLSSMLALLYRAQIYFGNYFQKLKYKFGKILQILKAQVLPLAIFWKNPTKSKC